MGSRPASTQSAVWYFIAATFIVIGPSIFFRDASIWLTIGFLILGLVVFAFGLVVFRRERRLRQSTPSTSATDRTTS